MADVSPSEVGNDQCSSGLTLLLDQGQNSGDCSEKGHRALNTFLTVAGNLRFAVASLRFENYTETHKRLEKHFPLKQS